MQPDNIHYYNIYTFYIHKYITCKHTNIKLQEKHLHFIKLKIVKYAEKEFYKTLL